MVRLSMYSSQRDIIEEACIMSKAVVYYRDIRLVQKVNYAGSSITVWLLLLVC
jgi:hypothetical protein